MEGRDILEVESLGLVTIRCEVKAKKQVWNVSQVSHMGNWVGGILTSITNIWISQCNECRKRNQFWIKDSKFNEFRLEHCIWISIRLGYVQWTTEKRVQCAMWKFGLEIRFWSHQDIGISGSCEHSQNSVQFIQSCPTLCYPMDCSPSGFPAHHQLPEIAQTHVHQVSDGHPIISSSVVPFSSCPESFPASGSFPTSQFPASGGQSTGASALASVLPMNIQDWFPLGLTGLILQSKRLSRVFNTTIKSINSLVLSFLYSPTLTSIHDYWKNCSFD